MPEDLSASNFCKDRFCKNDIDPKIRVPSVPSVPEYGMYTAVHLVRQVHVLFSPFHFLFSKLSADTHFGALKINGNENRKDFDRRTKPFHEIVLL